MSLREDRSVRERRLREYAARPGNSDKDVRWGKFDQTFPQDVSEAICGLCGLRYDSQSNKALHLVQDHRAVVTDDGNGFYEYIVRPTA